MRRLTLSRHAGHRGGELTSRARSRSGIVSLLSSCLAVFLTRACSSRRLRFRESCSKSMRRTIHISASVGCSSRKRAMAMNRRRNSWAKFGALSRSDESRRSSAAQSKVDLNIRAWRSGFDAGSSCSASRFPAHARDSTFAFGLCSDVSHACKAICSISSGGKVSRPQTTMEQANTRQKSK